MTTPQIHIQTAVRVTNKQVIVDGKPEKIAAYDDTSWLTSIYKHLGIQYPKFFKMDNLCKAGFLASEFVMRKAQASPSTEKKDWSVIVFNHYGSLDNDRTYQTTIQDPANYYPSPAIFVYTLSNIVTGEIAIRHKIMGESCSYIQEQFDAEAIFDIGTLAFQNNADIKNLLIGWIEYMKGSCDVLLFHLSSEKSIGVQHEWDIQTIEKFFHTFA